MNLSQRSRSTNRSRLAPIARGTSGLSVVLVAALGCATHQDDGEVTVSDERLASLSSAQREKVDVLVDRALVTTLDDETLKTAVEQYRSLSPAELDAFNILRMRRQIEAQPETDARQLAMVTDLRLDVNRIALQRYGKGSNAISPAELDRILEELMDGPYAALKAAGAGPAEEAIEPQACTNMSFPSTATNLEGSGPYEYEYASVTLTGQTDCDWRFSYVGTYTHIDPENLDSELLVWSFDDHTGMAHYGQYIGSTFYNMTRVIFGSNRVWFWCGGPGGVYVTMN